MYQFRFVFMLAVVLAVLGCSEDQEYEFTASPTITAIPTSAVPTTALSGTQTASAASTSLSCGLNGSFGLCTTDSSGFTSRQFIVITGCNHLEFRDTYYVSPGCRDADQYYDRREYYSMTTQASSLVSGAQEVNLTMTLITESIQLSNYLGTDWLNEIHCEGAKTTFPTTPMQSFVPTSCFSSDLSRLGASTMTVYQLLKQVDGGLYWGTDCGNEGAWGYCLVKGDRPTSLESFGFPNWQ